MGAYLSLYTSDFILYTRSKETNYYNEGTNFKEGHYELVFFIGDYFKNLTNLPKTPFLDEVVVRFGISKPEEHYHVPLLVSPWSYSTYRGS